MKIVIFKKAKQDMLEILQYIKQDNPDAASKLISRFKKVFLDIANFPNIGSAVKDDYLAKLGYRAFFVEKYSIWYTQSNDNLFIKRVLHSARNFKTLLKN